MHLVIKFEYVDGKKPHFWGFSLLIVLLVVLLDGQVGQRGLAGVDCGARRIQCLDRYGLTIGRHPRAGVDTEVSVTPISQWDVDLHAIGLIDD